MYIAVLLLQSYFLDLVHLTSPSSSKRLFLQKFKSENKQNFFKSSDTNKNIKMTAVTKRFSVN